MPQETKRPLSVGPWPYLGKAPSKVRDPQSWDLRHERELSRQRGKRGWEGGRVSGDGRTCAKAQRGEKSEWWWRARGLQGVVGKGSSPCLRPLQRRRLLLQAGPGLFSWPRVSRALEVGAAAGQRSAVTSKARRLWATRSS